MKKILVGLLVLGNVSSFAGTTCILSTQIKYDQNGLAKIDRDFPEAAGVFTTYDKELNSCIELAKEWKQRALSSVEASKYVERVKMIFIDKEQIVTQSTLFVQDVSNLTTNNLLELIKP